MSMYWKWEQQVPESICEAFIQEMHYTKLEDATISDGYGGTTKSVKINDVRNNKVAFMPVNHWMEGILFNFARYANTAAGWNFDAPYNEEIQYVEYGAGEKYNWHTDKEVYLPQPGMRKLSVVLQLSKSSDFTGGGLYLKDAQHEIIKESVLKEQGDVVVFPSFLLHKAEEVTSGVRRAVVLWATGPALK